jgi:predicted lipoprotein with Yx(FWY)xxD motif
MSLSKRLIIAASLAAIFAAPAAFAGEAPAKKAGSVLANPAGMTLYVFDKDQANSGKSVCNGGCAASWPPFIAPADAKASGDYTIVTRDDNTKQWAYKGRPLYLWANDKKAGDTTGDKVGGVWHAVKD